MNRRRLLNRFHRHKKVHTIAYFEGFEYDETDFNYIDNKNIVNYDEKTNVILIYIMITLTIIETLGFMSKNVY